MYSRLHDMPFAVSAEVLEERAIRAYFLSEGSGADQPAYGRTQIVGNTITLANTKRPLATYQIIQIQNGVRLRRQSDTQR